MALTSKPGVPKFKGTNTSSQSRYMYNKRNNNQEFFIYGPQCENISIWLFGWPLNNQTGPILLPSYPLTYIIMKYGNMEDFVCYRENDEVPADAASRRLNH